MDNETLYIDPQKAFTEAITKGALSDQPTWENYAGSFMYMHSDNVPGGRRDWFKHIDARHYREVTHIL